MDKRHIERMTFDKVPEIYDRVRPSYPPALFVYAFRYLRASIDTHEPRVLEIGPGTGQATASLLEHGANVTSVEIGPSLAAFLRRKFASQERLEVVNAPFEEAELAATAFDLVFCATAFHWIDPSVRFAKPHGILRPGGALAVVSTNQIESGADRGFFDRVMPIYVKYGEKDDRPNLPGEDVVPIEFGEMESSKLFADVTLYRYRWNQTYTTASYADQMRSYSVMQMMEEDALESLIAEIGVVIDAEFGGSITRPVVMTLTIGRKATS